MIPKRKKTPEEIAALREGLGIPDKPPAPPEQKTPPRPTPEPEANPVPNPPPAVPNPPPVHLEPDSTDTTPEPKTKPVHLNIPPAPTSTPEISSINSHSLRKHELPLAPAPAVTNKTAIPTHRHDPRDINEIRKREALAKLNQPEIDPAIHLRRQTAHPILYIPGYLLSIAAAITIYKHFHYLTPLALLLASLALVIFIALKKPRSRHHAALIFILIFLTAVFGGLHYAPLFQNAS